MLGKDLDLELLAAQSNADLEPMDKTKSLLPTAPVDQAFWDSIGTIAPVKERSLGRELLTGESAELTPSTQNDKWRRKLQTGFLPPSRTSSWGDDVVKRALAEQTIEGNNVSRASVMHNRMALNQLHTLNNNYKKQALNPASFRDPASREQARQDFESNFNRIKNAIIAQDPSLEGLIPPMFGNQVNYKLLESSRFEKLNNQLIENNYTAESIKDLDPDTLRGITMNAYRQLNGDGASAADAEKVRVAIETMTPQSREQIINAMGMFKEDLNRIIAKAGENTLASGLRQGVDAMNAASVNFANTVRAPNSTPEQIAAAGSDALAKAGMVYSFSGHMADAAHNMPQLKEALEAAKTKYDLIVKGTIMNHEPDPMKLYNVLKRQDAILRRQIQGILIQANADPAQWNPFPEFEAPTKHQNPAYEAALDYGKPMNLGTTPRVKNSFAGANTIADFLRSSPRVRKF